MAPLKRPCSVCGGNRMVRKDGNVTLHLSPSGDSSTCPGSGHPPKATPSPAHEDVTVKPPPTLCRRPDCGRPRREHPGGGAIPGVCAGFQGPPASGRPRWMEAAS